MSNMKYCMFENTVKNIQQCIEEGFDENDWGFEQMVDNTSSKYEAKAILEFIDLYCDIAQEFGDFEYDDDHFNHLEARQYIKQKWDN